MISYSDMQIEKGQIRAPEIGRVWLNSTPLNLRQLRGRAILIDFWDYTCVNCIRTLPYVQIWHERYKDKGLTVIGVHTPEFIFAQYEQNVERGIQEFGLTYPNVLDSDYELWQAYANRAWPSKYLIDKDGYGRYTRMGEGGYAETEAMIQTLLYEIDPDVELPPLMDPLRESDRPGAVCYPPTSEIYLGSRRGRILNEGGYVEAEHRYEYRGDPMENFFAAHGRFRSTMEYLESAEEGARVSLIYGSASVNMVMASTTGKPVEVALKQDGTPLTKKTATMDTRFRANMSYVLADKPRMVTLVDNHDFEAHVLELTALAPGAAFYAFTFTSCVDPKSCGIADVESAHK